MVDAREMSEPQRQHREKLLLAMRDVVRRQVDAQPIKLPPGSFLDQLRQLLLAIDRVESQ
jgi:hypothetical protein